MVGRDRLLESDWWEATSRALARVIPPGGTVRRIHGRLQTRLVRGVPWGTLVLCSLLMAAYLVVQNGLDTWTRPLVLPFLSWSYRHLLGILLGPVSHLGPGHLLENLAGVLVFGTVAEYVVGHGFPRRPRARHPAQDHADRLEGVDPFDEVSAALVKGEPTVEDRLRSLGDGRVVVVPLFVSDGYFVGEAIPDRVESARPEGVTVEYARPVGTHEGVTDVVVRRALSAVDGRPGDVELAVLGHGSEHGSANRGAVEGHARRIREQGTFGAVSSYFVEEEPTVERLPAEAGASAVVAVPLFVAKGHHVREDIPDALGVSGRHGTVEGTSITCTDPVGTDPAVAGIVFERATEALGARASDRPDGDVPETTHGQTRRNAL